VQTGEIREIDYFKRCRRLDRSIRPRPEKVINSVTESPRAFQAFAQVRRHPFGAPGVHGTDEQQDLSGHSRSSAILCHGRSECRRPVGGRIRAAKSLHIGMKPAPVDIGAKNMNPGPTDWLLPPSTSTAMASMRLIRKWAAASACKMLQSMSKKVSIRQVFGGHPTCEAPFGLTNLRIANELGIGRPISCRSRNNCRHLSSHPSTLAHFFLQLWTRAQNSNLKPKYGCNANPVTDHPLTTCCSVREG